jgi:hypothetical protein
MTGNRESCLSARADIESSGRSVMDGNQQPARHVDETVSVTALTSASLGNRVKVLRLR